MAGGSARRSKRRMIARTMGKPSTMAVTMVNTIATIGTALLGMPFMGI
jgi:hypothetical protein